MTTKLLYGDITEKIIGAAFEVHNTLGKGLTEKTYQNALAVRLRRIGACGRGREGINPHI
jgi:GxxExxY protein